MAAAVDVEAEAEAVIVILEIKLAVKTIKPMTRVEMSVAVASVTDVEQKMWSKRPLRL